MKSQRGHVSAGGYSATISGALKILVGVVIKIGGWVVSDSMQSEIVQGVSMLVGLGFDMWGVVQVYQARQERGDIDWKGKRVKDVEVIVAQVPVEQVPVEVNLAVAAEVPPAVAAAVAQESVIVVEEVQKRDPATGQFR